MKSKKKRTFETQEGPELIHGAQTPSSSLLNAHYLDQAKDGRGTLPTERTSRM